MSEVIISAIIALVFIGIIGYALEILMGLAFYTLLITYHITAAIFRYLSKASSNTLKLITILTCTPLLLWVYCEIYSGLKGLTIFEMLENYGIIYYYDPTSGERLTEYTPFLYNTDFNLFLFLATSIIILTPCTILNLWPTSPPAKKKEKPKEPPLPTTINKEQLEKDILSLLPERARKEAEDVLHPKDPYRN